MLHLHPVILLTILLVLISYPLGVWGFFILGDPYSSSDPFYEALRLYSINSPNSPLPLQLNLARFLAAFAVFLGIFATLFHLFREFWQELSLRFTNNHIVIAGKNPSALALAKDILAQKKRIILLCSDREDSALSQLKHDGAILLEGSLSDKSTLIRANLPKASHFLAFTDNDPQNAELILAAEKVIKNRNEPNALQCHALLQKRTFLKSFREHSLLTNSLDQMEISLFHPGDLGARIALKNHPIEQAPSGELAPNLGLVLFEPSREGFAYLRHALHIGHFASRSKLTVSLITTNPDHTKSRLENEFPSWREIANINIIPSLDSSATALSKAFLDSSPPPNHWLTIICASADDELNLGLSQHLRHATRNLNCQILCLLQKNENLASILEKEEISKLSPVSVIKSGPSLMTWNQVVATPLDQQAKIIHADYLVTQKEEKTYNPQKNASHFPWENLGEIFRSQNRLQADHIPVKLRAIGIDPNNLPDLNTLNTKLEENIELLSEMEHARWIAATFLMGWTHASGEKNNTLKTSPYLIPWNDLPEKIKKRDRDAVRNIAELV